MPVDRTLAEGLARSLVEMYTELEHEIAADIGRRLKLGIDSPQWAGEKLASINDLRNSLQRMLRKIDGPAGDAAAQQLVLAFARGGEAALDELAAVGGLTEAQLAALRASLPGAEAINVLTWSLVSTLRGTHVRVLRWGLDVYREVVASTLPHVLAGTSTRLSVAQRTLDRLLARGVTGFTDKAGRNWDLASYVEMAVRTGTAQAAVQGHLDRLGAAGLDLVQVSNAPQECVRCRPWEGKVLDRTTGGERVVEVEHGINDGEMVRVEVAGSVVEAVAAGLMHPNCRHSLSVYIPGVSRPVTNTEDPQGDKDRQRLRLLERRVRRVKLRAAAALTDDARRAHQRKVADLQAAIRDHIERSPSTLFRQRHREQIGTAR